jgi:hypothetical protein
MLDASGKAKLTIAHPAESRQIWVTKQLSAPLLHILNIINGFDVSGDLKYQLYSSHDTNIANILMQISPYFDWKTIPFAANIYIELYTTNKIGHL